MVALPVRAYGVVLFAFLERLAWILRVWSLFRLVDHPAVLGFLPPDGDSEANGDLADADRWGWLTFQDMLVGCVRFSLRRMSQGLARFR